MTFEAFKTSQNIASVQKTTVSPRKRHNPYEGKENAWQLNETVDEFLDRLPPTEDHETQDGWLWVANPYARADQFEADYLKPELPKYMQDGRELLERFLERKEDGQTPSTEELKCNILALATKCRIRSGKVRLSVSFSSYFLKNSVDAFPTSG